MKRTSTLLLAALVMTQFLASCSGSTVKDGISKAGNAAGRAAGEFVEGAAGGVEKSFKMNMQAAPGLQAKGLSMGSHTVGNDSTGGHDNLLSLYLIWDKDFTGGVTAKAFDKENLEMGRVTVQVAGKAGEAKYVEFAFDQRTNMDTDTRIIVE